MSRSREVYTGARTDIDSDLCIHFHWAGENGCGYDLIGVTVSACHVTNIVLPNNNLVGPLPIEIGDLTGLVELKLRLNHLTGSLPSTIINLVFAMLISIFRDLIAPIIADLTGFVCLARGLYGPMRQIYNG